jgi:hypothetical protein
MHGSTGSDTQSATLGGYFPRKSLKRASKFFGARARAPLRGKRRIGGLGIGLGHVMTPLDRIGREHAVLSVTGGCPWRGGDRASMTFFCGQYCSVTKISRLGLRTRLCARDPKHLLNRSSTSRSQRNASPIREFRVPGRPRCEKGLSSQGTMCGNIR